MEFSYIYNTFLSSVEKFAIQGSVTVQVHMVYGFHLSKTI